MTCLREAGTVERLDLGSEVELTHLHYEMTFEGSLGLQSETGEVTTIFGERKPSPHEPDVEPLSQIVEALNERFGLKLDDRDQLLFDQFEQACLADPEVAAQARNNTIENFRLMFDRKFLNTVVGRMDDSEAIFKRILDDPSSRQAWTSMPTGSIARRGKREGLNQVGTFMPHPRPHLADRGGVGINSCVPWLALPKSASSSRAKRWEAFLYTVDRCNSDWSVKMSSHGPAGLGPKGRAAVLAVVVAIPVITMPTAYATSRSGHAGYQFSESGGNAKASATFVVPHVVRCPSTPPSNVSLGAQIGTVNPPGIAVAVIVGCDSSGFPTYFAAASVGTVQIFPDTVMPGDTVTVFLRDKNFAGTATVHDLTANWSETLTGRTTSPTVAALGAFVGCSCPVTQFGPTTFSQSRIDGHSLTGAQRSKVITSSGIIEISASVLSAGDTAFTLKWKVNCDPAVPPGC